MLIVIGDELDDRDENLTTVCESQEGCPVVSVEREQRPGGASAVAAMVRALGGDCLLLGNSRAHRQRSIKSRVWLDGELIYRIDDDVTESFAEDIVKLIANVKVDPSVVLLSSYAKGAIDRTVVEACLARGWRVVADPHITDDHHIFDGVWAIKCNAVENRDQRYSHGAIRSCVTHGDGGMSVTERDVTEWLDATPVACCDSVGCGDQVLAAIGVMLAVGNDWRAACEWGNLAAGLKCAKRGTTPVTIDELRDAVIPVTPAY